MTPNGDIHEGGTRPARLKRFLGRNKIGLLSAVLAAVVAFALLVVVGLSSTGGRGSSNRDAPAPRGESAGLLATAAATPAVEATIDLTRATVVVTRDPSAPVPGSSSGDRFIIEKIGVNAPLSYKVVGTDGQMPNPSGPDDVAYYDFSSWPGLGGVPGSGGNAVFSGHVDSGRVACKNGSVPPPCEAVFWDLNLLRVGDVIEVRLNGQSFRYRVTSNQVLPADSADWNAIVASTAQEWITVITCGGDFNRETRTYDSRQVVTAVRE